MRNPFRPAHVTGLNDKYIALADGLHLHLTADGGYIRPSYNAVATEDRKRSLAKRASFLINATGAQLLSYADGTHNVASIVEKCRDRLGEPKQDFDQKLRVFVEKAVKARHVDLFDTPRQRTLETTGNLDSWYPLHATIEVTSRCNLRCKHCYRFPADGEHEPDPQDFSLEEGIRLLDMLGKNGVMTIELSGGEPFMHPHFVDILEHALELFPLVAVITNGTLIADSACERLTRHPNRDNLTFSISLDGSNEAIHDRMRGVAGAFNAATKAIRALTSRGFRVRAGTTLSLDNAGDFENMILTAKSLGCWGLAFGPALPFGRGATMAKASSEEETVAIAENINYVAHKYRDFVGLIEGELLKTVYAGDNCGAGYRSVTIAPNGDVRTCPIMPTIGPVLGNVLREEYDAIFSRPLIMTLKSLKHPREELCGSCEYLGFCKFCTLRGLYTYANVKKDCVWAAASGVDQWCDVAMLKDPYALPGYSSASMLDLN